MMRTADTTPTVRAARWRRAFSATAATAVLLPVLAVGGAATAAATSGPAQIGVKAATVDVACEGPFGNLAVFTVTSEGGIPAGSTWQVSTSKVGPLQQFYATPDTPDVTWSAVNRTTITLTAQRAFADGEVIRITPSGHYIDTMGSTTVQATGYGGSAQMGFSYRNGSVIGPCDD